MKKGHKLFFAIPFDAATKSQYERITKMIRKKYPGITTVIGSNEIGPSKRYSDFKSFKAQNRELHQQFTKQITEADVLIADLTHNNPNVHVELGIALMQNKNILRVTGRSVSELPFDVRQLEIATYRNESALIKIITRYLDTFLEIKTLSLDPKNEPFFSNVAQNKELDGISQGRLGETGELDGAIDFPIRDGAVRARFSFLAAVTPADWFGVCFRVGGVNPWIGSHMVYVRQEGSVDLATYPGPEVINLISAPARTPEQHELFIDFENDALTVRLNNNRAETNKLTHQRAGRFVLVAYRSKVLVISADVISRDTIDLEV